MKRPTARQSAWQWQERIGVRDRKTLDGDQSLFFNRLMDLGDPLEDYDAVNKKYVDDVFGDGEIIVVIGSVDDIADLDLDPGSIAGSDADAVMAVHLAMYDHTLIGDGLDDTAFLKHSLATAANDFLVASGAGVYVKKTLAETQAILGCRLTGWIDAPALTFSAADAPVYTVTCNGDYTLIIPVGARIALTHSGATKYFIVVKTSYSSPNTTFTLYGGTDYTLAAGAITNPYYSIAKAPVGFPLDPAKWTVLLTDSTDRHQSNPVKDTIYNPGSLSISLPIGIWNISFQVILVCAASSGTMTDVYGGLSSSLSSFDNQALRGRGYLGGPTAGIFIGMLSRSTVLNIATKTTYYVLCMTDLDNQSVIGFNNASDASLDVRAVCAFL